MQFRKGYQIKPNYDELSILKYFPSVPALYLSLCEIFSVGRIEKSWTGEVWVS